jgi:hypothetical protein
LYSPLWYYASPFARSPRNNFFTMANTYKEYIEERDPADENDGKTRWAVNTAEAILRSSHPPSALDSLAKEYRPLHWSLLDWRDHVWNRYIDNYVDRKTIDGLSLRGAVATAYLDTVFYLIDRPDRPHLLTGKEVYRGMR